MEIIGGGGGGQNRPQILLSVKRSLHGLIKNVKDKRAILFLTVGLAGRFVQKI